MLCSHSRARVLGEMGQSCRLRTGKGCLKAKGCLIDGLASVQSYMLVCYFVQEHAHLVSA